MSVIVDAGRKAHVNAAAPSAMEICTEGSRTVTGGLSSPAASSERALLLPSAPGYPCASPTAVAAKKDLAPPQRRASRRLQSKRLRKKARTSPAPGGEGDEI